MSAHFVPGKVVLPETLLYRVSDQDRVQRYSSPVDQGIFFYCLDYLNACTRHPYICENWEVLLILNAFAGDIPLFYGSTSGHRKTWSAPSSSISLPKRVEATRNTYKAKRQLSIYGSKRIGKMNQHETINYVEFPARDIQATKSFFKQAFGWSFQDFGPEYTAFSNQGIDGGFYHSELRSSTGNGAALIVFYSQDIEATQETIEKANGIIIKPLFAFPGGRRFHFEEPSGNEFAVWSDKKV